MSAWFPRISARGDVASGDTHVFVNGEPRSPGHHPVWIGDRLVHSMPDGDDRTFAGGGYVPGAYGALTGSDDDRWFGFSTLGDGRLDLYQGSHLVRSFLGATCGRLAPGRFAYLTPYQSVPPAYERTLFVNDAPLYRGAILDVVLSEHDCVVQLATSTYGRSLRRAEDDARVSVRDDEIPIATFRHHGIPWVVATVQPTGTIVHPFGDPLGYLIEGDLYFPDARLFDDRLLVVGSTARGEPLFDNWIDFSAPRVDLSKRSAPEKPPSAPEVPPAPEEPPMAQTLPERIAQIVRAYVRVYPVPRLDVGPASPAFEDLCRLWCFRLAQQVAYATDDEDWGVKSASPDRPQSKDSLTYNGSRLINYDLLLGVGTGQPTLNLGAVGEDITGQTFMPVGAVNHLGGSPSDFPAPKEPDPSELKTLRELVIEQAARIKALEIRMGELEARPRSQISGTIVSIESVSRPGQLMSVWDNAVPKFDRSRVGDGERFILKEQS